MTKISYIGVGSNLGDKLDNCLKAIDHANEIPGCKVKAKSHFFRTEPVGVKVQDWYVNGVFSLLVDVSAQHLLQSLLAIETGMGRERKRKWDSRIIDLDILLFGEEVISEKGLKVPHPLMHLRRFVLVPMVSLAPDVVHPVLGKTMVELLAGVPKKAQTVVPMGVA
ncbi:MAG: 2-amino-4-hydroxy-6-hydroxymethyldihydropteridine diphosphokinase [Desulfobacteraceae bacterium]|nr:MAG: 2-amino-4-hydroxy-6-hydroxymethyldihydropteridine diphosphokinase [Desulfobacteraceae bacterium]